MARASKPSAPKRTAATRVKSEAIGGGRALSPPPPPHRPARFHSRVIRRSPTPPRQNERESLSPVVSVVIPDPVEALKAAMDSYTGTVGRAPYRYVEPLHDQFGYLTKEFFERCRRGNIRPEELWKLIDRKRYPAFSTAIGDTSDLDTVTVTFKKSSSGENKMHSHIGPTPERELEILRSGISSPTWFLLAWGNLVAVITSGRHFGDDLSRGMLRFSEWLVAHAEHHTWTSCLDLFLAAACPLLDGRVDAEGWYNAPEVAETSGLEVACLVKKLDGVGRVLCPPKPAIKDKSRAKGEICRNYNLDKPCIARCETQNYRHACSTCGRNHRATECRVMRMGRNGNGAGVVGRNGVGRGRR